jgi:hypothetical protein
MDSLFGEFKLPWETGIVGAILSGGPIVSSSSSGPTGSAYNQWVLERTEVEESPLAADPVEVKRKSIETIDATLEETAMSRKRRRGALRMSNWSMLEDRRRARVLDQWTDLALLARHASALFKRIIKECGEASTAHEVAWDKSVVDILSPKSTSTLSKRIGSLMAYCRWAKTTYGSATSAFPFHEPACYDYVDFLRTGGAKATKANSFIESVSFIGGLLEIEGFQESANSHRVKGVACTSYKSKRLTRKARGLKADELATFELAVFRGGSLCDRYFAGFVCFITHARLRFRDGQKITADLDLDEPEVDEGAGFLEAMAEHHKTANTGKRQRLPLPVVALSRGVSGNHWAREWLKIRKLLEIEQATGLMPTPRGDGCSFLARPLSLTDATVWMREILVSGGFSCSQVSDIYTHSCRATLLSWAAKFGVSGGHRRLLGYHAKAGDHSMLEYSRDALAGPMREVAKIVEGIRLKTFLPDATRSGYFPSQPVAPPQQPVLGEGVSSTPPRRACLDDVESMTGAHVYIGRGCKRKFGGLARSIWHNPVSLKRDDISRDEAVASYNEYLHDKANQKLLDKVRELGGKLLTCHCKLSQSCHGDVLVQAWHAQSGQAKVSGGEDPSSEEETSSSSESEQVESDSDFALETEFCRETIVSDVANRSAVTERPAELPAGGLWVHGKWGTWHVGSAGLDKFECGRKLSDSSLDRYMRMGAWPCSTVAWCQVCLKKADPLGPEVKDAEDACPVSDKQ